MPALAHAATDHAAAESSPQPSRGLHSETVPAQQRGNAFGGLGLDEPVSSNPTPRSRQALNADEGRYKYVGEPRANKSSRRS